MPTGNPYIDSILTSAGGSDINWASNTLTYFFAPGGATGYYNWRTAEIAAFESALKAWSDVANLTFTEAGDAGSADLLEHIVDDNEMSTNLGGPGTLGGHSQPDADNWTSPQLEGFFNRDAYSWPDGNGYDTDSLEPGGLALSVFIHEIGHALGLAHPWETDLGNGVSSGRMPGVTEGDDTDFGRFDLNQTVFTIMSYNDGWKVQDPWGSDQHVAGYNSGLGALDIAAIQFLYGANMSTGSGDDTYVIKNKFGWSSIWDTGGTDKIVYRGDGDVVINLNAATLDRTEHAGGFLSYVKGDGKFGGFTIAGDITDALADQRTEVGVIIENAKGGSGDDKLTGNGVGNLLIGRLGGDKIVGLGGNDTLRGNAGNDTVLGGTGNDVIDGGAGKDVVKGAGGADELTGGRGVDRMIGGLGDDSFVYREHHGKDTIVDFADNHDTLVLDENLWTGSLTVRQVIRQFATDTGHDIVFDFGDGDVLTLTGVASRADLLNDISFV